jgi:penicillin-binding protein 1C
VPVVDVQAPTSAVLLDRDGRLLGARIAADEQWRFPPGPVPERFATALIAAEDQRFRRHPGVDPLALARAMRSKLQQRRVVSGASTLTMQTVRIARGNPPRTLGEKLRELVLAPRLELARSKDDILAMYAAHAPFGGNTVGLEAAAWRYFQRPSSDLSWGEAATLAVLPNEPALVRPGRNEARLRAKRDRLLERLHAQGAFDAVGLAAAKAERLPGPPGRVPRLAPHLLGPGRTATTLDRSLQERARDVVARHATELGGRGIHNVAALVVDVRSGEVLAYVGNVPDPAAPGAFVDVVRAPRSTGSTLKPLLYEAMLAAGELLPDELVPDVPLRIGGFAPENFDRRYDGALPASEALARSRNVPAVWMLQRHAGA